MKKNKEHKANSSVDIYGVLSYLNKEEVKKATAHEIAEKAFNRTKRDQKIKDVLIWDLEANGYVKREEIRTATLWEITTIGSDKSKELKAALDTFQIVQEQLKRSDEEREFSENKPQG